jgi:hypothetical protein
MPIRSYFTRRDDDSRSPGILDLGLRFHIGDKNSRYF